MYSEETLTISLQITVAPSLDTVLSWIAAFIYHLLFHKLNAFCSTHSDDILPTKASAVFCGQCHRCCTPCKGCEWFHVHPRTRCHPRDHSVHSRNNAGTCTLVCMLITSETEAEPSVFIFRKWNQIALTVEMWLREHPRLLFQSIIWSWCREPKMETMSLRIILRTFLSLSRHNSYYCSLTLSSTECCKRFQHSWRPKLDLDYAIECWTDVVSRQPLTNIQAC